MKTAVDNIIAKLNNVKPIEFCSIETIKEWCEQAKEIEKQQIIKAYQQGVTEEYGDTLDFSNCSDAEDYYNNRYKNN